MFVNVFGHVVMFMDLTEYEAEYHVRHTPRQNRHSIYLFELVSSFDLSIYVF